MAQATLSRTVSLIEIFAAFDLVHDSLGALQFLRNLFEHFLVRKNQRRKGEGKSKTSSEYNGSANSVLILDQQTDTI